MTSPTPDEPADAHVVHRPERTRYELLIDGQLRGVADYRELDRRVVFTHTEVDVPLRRRGYSTALVRFALDNVRASSKLAGATCWFVSEFAEQHPEYAGLFD